MRVQIKNQITINASAKKIWDVLANDFENISLWASVITKSKAITGIPSPKGAKVGGRICSAPGFSEAQEEFTYYDEQSMRYGYKGTKGLPFFIKYAENNWVVRSLEGDKSMVEWEAEVDFNLFPGLFIAPIFKLVMGRKSSHMGEELKYYVENNQPHPRKQKQLQAVQAKSI